ncbi:hypothetical protein M0R45_011287 [Rubus argutus]|uniref:Uncharacterized protein n=1 Tax=Rubus argutus TaxID=59490 RepID=A0AAW1Y9P4_RUBAR
MVGNTTAQQTSAGCNVTSCNYGGFVEWLHNHYVVYISSATLPRTTTISATHSPTNLHLLPGLAPIGGPAGSASAACSLVNPLTNFPSAVLLLLYVKFMMAFL